MKDTEKLRRIAKGCFEEKEWEWLSQQPNFMKLYEAMATLDDFEALCAVGATMLNAKAGEDRAGLALRLRENRDRLDQEWM